MSRFFVSKAKAKNVGFKFNSVKFTLSPLFFIALFSGALLASSLVIEQGYARRANISGEADINAGRNKAAIEKLSAIEAKDAAEYYLLGRAYMNLGDRVQAHKAWTEALHINNELKRGKWKFLFPPNKPLKGAQKKKLKDQFEDEYQSLGATVKRLKKTQARDLKNKATRTRIDAKKRDAKETQLNKAAAAKGKSIDSKQRMADRKARSNQKRSPKRTKHTSSNLGLIIFGVIVFIIILAVIFGRRSGGGRRVTYYDVGYDDGRFERGPFYYRGTYYRSHDHFYGAHGYHYTNRMYRDNYNQWGSGQRYDEALDNEIHNDIDAREDLSMAAAEEGYQADVMRADAEHYEQDAHELERDVQDGDDAAGFFDDDHEFDDDEFADDEGAGEFTDDEVHSDYDDGGYDDGGYDDGGYDDGGFEDDPEA